MFKYFILRKQQQLFCYFCGIVLAMVLMLLFPSVFRGSGFYLLLSSVALFWAGLARHCCKVSDEAAFCLIQRPYISKTLLT
ncbi:hypothetical protein ACRXFW_27010, partial [Klebsiella pneumoniae]